MNAITLSNKEIIPATIRSYSGKLFHPGAVEAFEKVAVHDSFWLDISNLDMNSVLNAAISDTYEIELTIDLLEQFAFTISKIIDARSRFTISHSFGVSAVAYYIAGLLGYPEEKSRRIRIAGLLHDMGKIAVPTEIIDKNGPLTREERTNIQTHAYFTWLILKDVDVLGEIRDWASNHHENHDGSGYPKNLGEARISEEMDIISYADIYTALSENRPYREGLATEEILSIMQSQFVIKHGNAVYDIITRNVDAIDRICKEAIREGADRYDKFEETMSLQQA